MLKKFILNTLSSFVGTWIAIMLLGIVVVLVGVGIAAKIGASSNEGNISRHSILTVELQGPIEESETPIVPDYSMILSGGIEQPQTLRSIVQAIKNGAKNKDIDALYLKCGGVGAGLATLDAIRDEIVEFKKSGKKVYAYADGYSTGDYYVASAADSIFVNPYGMVELHGLNGTILYMKDLFDKLGITFQVIKVGTFKSAVEPYIMNQMSEPARAQLDTLYGNLWQYIREGIAKQRKKLTPAKIDSLVNVDNITFASMETLLSSGLVDAAVYERTMDDRLAKNVGVDKKKLNFVSVSTMESDNPWAALNKKNEIAVLYATGDIVDGSNTGINYENLVPIITKLADDKNVKGMVLRVNSPGGSAFGSDQIGEALDYFQSKGKPLAVSMGDYAASGGYWISCCANRIFADPMTITGSIGIFGLIPNGEGLLEKIGVNPQETGTNVGANFPTLYKKMDERQLAVMQANVERGYDRFISRVSKGRKMPEQKVRTIAEGRVWDAMKAKEIGLVDQLGSLNDAIEWTSKQAGLKDNYGISVYPEMEPNIWNIMLAGTTLEKVQAELMRDNFSELAVSYVRRYVTREPIQARMPEISIGFK